MLNLTATDPHPLWKPFAAIPDPQTGEYDFHDLRMGFIVSDCGQDSFATRNTEPVAQDLAGGTVLGVRAGHPTPLDLTATDGAQVASAILARGWSPRRTASSVQLLIGNAIVLGSRLHWPRGATVDQIAAGIAQLRACCIKVV